MPVQGQAVVPEDAVGPHEDPGPGDIEGDRIVPDSPVSIGIRVDRSGITVRLEFFNGQVFDGHATLVAVCEVRVDGPVQAGVVPGEDGLRALGEPADECVVRIRLEVPDVHPREQVVNGVGLELEGRIIIFPGWNDHSGCSVREI